MAQFQSFGRGVVSLSFFQMYNVVHMDGIGERVYIKMCCWVFTQSDVQKFPFFPFVVNEQPLMEI